VINTTDLLLRACFGGLSVDWWEDVAFYLACRQHGGSGLGRSRTELLKMPLDQINRDVKRLNEQRRAEARAMQPKQK